MGPVAASPGSSRSAPAPPVLRLSDPRALDRAVAGGKGAGLAALVEAGLPVPEGLIVSAPACAALLDGAGVGGAAAELAARARAPEAGPDEAAWLDSVRAAIAAAPVPAALGAALRDALGPSMDGPLAVRSSGTAEDSAQASFAGQFESRLGVGGEPAVHAALRACLSSLFTPRLAAYLRAQAGRLPDGAPGLAVVVQRLVHAEAAGLTERCGVELGRALG